MTVQLPDEYEAPVLDRVPGGADVAGMVLPLCEPTTHRDDGKHSLICFAGAIGYHRIPSGGFERDAPDPMTAPGAVFTYTGPAHVRPLDRGITLDGDAEYDYLDRLPEGDYDVQIRFVRSGTPSPDE